MIRRLGGVVTLTTLALIAGTRGVDAWPAQENRAIRLVIVMRGDPADQRFRQVGPAGSYRYGHGRLQGTTTLRGAQVRVELLGSIRYANGSGPFTGFWTFTRADGAVVAFDYSGRATQTQDRTRLRGRLAVIGGTGAWTKVRGSGTVTGRRVGAVGGDVEYTVTLRLTGLRA